MIKRVGSAGCLALLLAGVALVPADATTPVSPPSKSASAASAAVFPAAVNHKYAGETAGKARLHTCLDQYHANKASNANGDLKWIQSGGGYYSLCLKKLKS
jgi:hypothetical protein